MEAAGLASQHKWGVILPTSARVANSIYEPAIATQRSVKFMISSGE